jgi:hypothetical protein
MRRRILTGLPAVEAVVAAAVSAVSHAGWWLEWHTRSTSGDGCRELADSGLVRECASSS